MRRCVVVLLAMAVAHSQTTLHDRPVLVLETKIARMVIELGGGSISDFHLAGLPLNPLAWS